MKQNHAQYKLAVGDLMMGKMSNLKGREKVNTVVSFTDASCIMKVEKTLVDSEETSVGERVPEQEDVKDFYEVRCIKRTWKQKLKELTEAFIKGL